MKEIDLIVEMEHGIKLTTEVTIEETIEKRIIVTSKTRDIRGNMKTCYKDTYDKDNHRTSHKDRSKDTKIETNTEMTAMAKLEAGEKKFTYMMMMKYLSQKLEECTKFYKQ